MSDEQKLPRVHETVSLMVKQVHARAMELREESGRLERQAVDLETAAETLRKLTADQWRSALLAVGRLPPPRRPPTVT